MMEAITMFLRSVTLKQVRSIEHVELHFGEDAHPRPWTVILGQNGCGKSTILRSIALLTAGSDALPELLRTPDEWIRNGHPRCEMSAVLETAAGEQRDIGLTIARGASLAAIFGENRETLERLDAAIANSGRNYFTAGYGVSRRFQSQQTFAPGSAFNQVRSRNIATLFSSDATLLPLEAWAADFHYRYGDDALAVLRDIFDQLLPGVSFREIDRQNSRVLFDTPDGVVPLDRLSDGYQNVAAWCGDLVSTVSRVFQDYRNPLEARGLLLIDEIDLHLHPVWQRRLREYLSLKLPHFQIVATTHSPLTAHQCGPGELHCFARPQPSDPPVLTAYPGEPRKLLLHQLLLDPIFGLETMDSLEVSRMKSQLTGLKGKKRRTKAETSRMSDLRVELADLPSWTGASLVPAKVLEAMGSLAAKAAAGKGRKRS
jgi:energy-coupling factor transporter ATP-binding protein EcfA2